MRLDKLVSVGTLNPSNLHGVAYPSLNVSFELGPSEVRRAYNIFFSSRNDQTTQYMRFARVNDRWFVAYRVVRQLAGVDGPVLKEFVQPGYPRNVSGQVDWQLKVGA